MSSEDFITIAANSELEIFDYGNHYCIVKRQETVVVVTLPKAEKLIAKIVEKIKDILGL